MKISAFAVLPVVALAATAGLAQQQKQGDAASPPAAEQGQRTPEKAPARSQGEAAMRDKQQQAQQSQSQSMDGDGMKAGTAQGGMAEKVIMAQDASQTRADRILGASVRSGQGEDADEIGEISDLVFDQDDKLAGAVVSVGGFLGIGEKSVAVSWNALQKVEREGEIAFVASVSREELENAPAFETIEDQEVRAAEERRKQEALERTNSGATTGTATGGAN